MSKYSIVSLAIILLIISIQSIHQHSSEKRGKKGGKGKAGEPEPHIVLEWEPLEKKKTGAGDVAAPTTKKQEPEPHN